MILEFQNDPGFDYLDRQFMLGDSLMVAPVFNENGKVKYYLPEGCWTIFLSGEVIEVENAAQDYSIVLNNIWDYKKVDNGKVEEIENGIKIIPGQEAKKIVVLL